MKTDSEPVDAKVDINLEELQMIARRARAATVQMAHDGHEGHLNGALSCIDILTALYFRFLQFDPENPRWSRRDRFLFSKGHACAGLYAVMMERGLLPREWQSSYAQNDSPMPSHPCKHALPLLEFSSGSLGHGAGVAAGIARALKMQGNTARVVALISDGECNEGSTWEAVNFAAAQKLGNLLLIVDNNGIQSVGRANELMGEMPLSGRFAAFGFEAREVDGHSFPELLTALESFPYSENRPGVIVARTVAGAGVNRMLDQVLWHYRTPSDDDLKDALIELDVCQEREAAV